jgi:chloramphenicol-sensitive protein RarD
MTPGVETNAQKEMRLGLTAGIGAYGLWGLLPVYLKAVDEASAPEILCHRIVWSVPFGALLILLRRQQRDVIAAFAAPRVLGLLALSAAAIAGNWLIYVWAVVHDRVLEASLGYYINPLMYVAAGVVLMGERLRPAQTAAVALAAAGVLVLTLGAGVFPWISLTLAALFTLYGYVRKTAPVGAMPGLFVETTLLSPMAMIILFWIVTAGGGVFLNQSLGKDALLMFAGPVTVVPLVLFALAARRLRLSTVGFLQYIAPTLQFAAALYYGEAFTLAHGISFGLIWIALAVFSFDAARATRPTRR